MVRSKKIIKIIFNISKRRKFLKRYFNLLNCYNQDIPFDLLIINEADVEVLNFKANNFNVLNIIYEEKIYGMNDIFRAIYKSKNLINKYKYSCFVEDDNFIFPSSLIKAKSFLDKNDEFIACSGNEFLFSKMNKGYYYYLNRYIGPSTNSLNTIKQRLENYNGALCYYSLMRKKVFIKILKSIIQIKDDNMSEVLFNFLTIKYGKIYELKDIYLAREYPRPKIYNIPSKKKWISNKNLLNDILFAMESIDKKKSDELLDISIYKYLSDRLKTNNKKSKYRILYLYKKFKFFLLNYFVIKNFMKNLNKV